MEKMSENVNGFVYHTPCLWESPTTSDLDKSLVSFNAKFNAVVQDEKVSVPGRAERKFASLDAIMKTIRPILAECGLYVQQMVAGQEMITMVRHQSGQFRCISAPMLQWQGQGTNALQNLGGAMTYLKRYYLSAALCLATEADDDGNSAGNISTKNQAKPSPKPIPSAPPAKTVTLPEDIAMQWESKVSACKTPEDFDVLSKEMAGVDDADIKLFVRNAMGKRMAETNILFTKGRGYHFADENAA